MRLISLDTETELIARGRQIPPLVCLTWAELDLSSPTPRIKAKGILDRHTWPAFVLPLLDDPTVHITGANIGFDILVTSALWPNPDPDGPAYDEAILSKWIAACDADRVSDLLTRQKLLDLAAGCYRREQLPDGRWSHHRYNLESLAWRLCRMRLDKGAPQHGKAASTKLTVAEQAAAAATEEDDESDNGWRLRYAELKDTPIELWPEDARKYAIDDAVAGALIWHEQESGRQSKHRLSRERPVFSARSSLGGASWQLPPQPSTIPSRSPQPVGPVAAIWAKVRENFGEDADPFVDQYRQTRGAIWLRAMSAHGLRTDPQAVARFAEWVEDKHVEVRDRLVIAGLMRVEYHLNREALAAWVEARCRDLGVLLGTKKAELLKLAQLLDAAEHRNVALAAADWLHTGRMLRSKPEPNTLEASARDLACASLAVLESVGLAYRTYHRDTKAAAEAMIAACERSGAEIPRTDSYDPKRHTRFECVKLDKEAVQSVRDGDIDGSLADYAEVSHLGKMLSADIPTLKSGTTAPIHTRFEELQETGRTGSSNPNVQNVARGEKCMRCRGKKQTPPCERCAGTGAELGARECFIPRELMWDAATQSMQPAELVDSDYNLGELHTLAQSCLWTFGWSKLADVLREGRDPHTVVACRILGISYEDGLKLKKIKDSVFDNARNSGKAVNFGKPGGLSAKTMRAYAVRSYGVDLPEERWVEILRMWDEEWQEMPHYFRWIDGMKGKRGRATVDKAGHRKIEQLYNLAQPWSGRLRAGCTYCSACNSGYQGLLSDILKRAGWYLFKACYLRGSMPGADALYGCRPVNEIHDQFLVEAPAVRGDAAARAVGALMNRAGAEICPDVPVRCDPILARRWSKRAEERRAGGVLVAWEDARLVVSGGARRIGE